MKLLSVGKAIDGTLTAQKWFPDGRKETVFEEKNMIMLSSKQNLLSSLYNEVQVVDVIANLKVGIGGTVDPEGQYPKPVNQFMGSLYSPILTIPISYTENLGVPSVTFIADLDQGTGNGQLITEAGLFKQSGAIFNIKTFPGIPKTSEFSLHFEWTIKIS